MPYFGLLDIFGKEVVGGGYHRVDAGSINYRISPPQLAEDQFSVINGEAICWVAKDDNWPVVVMLAFFDDVDSKSYIAAINFDGDKEFKLRVGEQMIIAPGQFQLGWCGLSGKRKNVVLPDNVPRVEKLFTRVDRLVNALLVAQGVLDRTSDAHRVVTEALEFND